MKYMCIMVIVCGAGAAVSLRPRLLRKQGFGWQLAGADCVNNHRCMEKVCLQQHRCHLLAFKPFKHFICMNHTPKPPGLTHEFQLHEKYTMQRVTETALHHKIRSITISTCKVQLYAMV
jgi:hypothetical protein